jgi:hypothetical protein
MSDYVQINNFENKCKSGQKEPAHMPVLERSKTKAVEFRVRRR